MLALIDGDIVLHRVGFTTENDEFWVARSRFDEMMDQILHDTNADQYRIYVSDRKENNFRYKIDPSYKANRIAPKPKHYEELREYCLSGEGNPWHSYVAEGMEADDALGIDQEYSWVNFGDAVLKSEGGWYVDDGYGSTVICSIDKDLLQIPGLHYNFVKKERIVVRPDEAQLSFYRSILTGDVSDNIQGIYGVGPKRAAKILSSWVSETDAELRIISEYLRSQCKTLNLQFLALPREEQQSLWDATLEVVRNNARLLKIKQEQDEPLWDFHNLKPMTELLSSFIQSKEGELNPSTEPTGPATTNGAG